MFMLNSDVEELLHSRIYLVQYIEAIGDFQKCTVQLPVVFTASQKGELT